MLKNKRYLLIGVSILVTICIGFILIHQYSKSKDEKLILEEINQTDENDIIIGDQNAAHSIVMYFDYNCIYCRKFFEEIYPEIKSNLIDSGDLKLVLRLICKPTDSRAIKAYKTVICINKFGDFLKLHKLLLHKSEIIYTEYFQELIDEYVSTNENVAECILSSDSSPIIKNIYQFQSLKTKGTPTFVIDNEIRKGLISFETILDLTGKNR